MTVSLEFNSKASKHEVMKWEENRVFWKACVPQSCTVFVTFRVWDQKSALNTKKCSGLFGAFLTAPVGQPALPSPRLKLAQLLVAAVGFCMGDHCVWNPLTFFLQSPFIIIRSRAHNLLYHGSQNGNHHWRHWGFIVSGDSWVNYAAAVTTRDPAGLRSSFVSPLLCLLSFPEKYVDYFSWVLLSLRSRSILCSLSCCCVFGAFKVHCVWHYCFVRGQKKLDCSATEMEDTYVVECIKPAIIDFFGRWGQAVTRHWQMITV